MTVRTGVDAHIGFANIADSALDRSGRQVYYNFVPDLIDGCFLRCCTLFSFLIGQVSPGQDHQVDIFFNLRPVQGEFLMSRVAFKFQPFAIVVNKTLTSVQKGVRVPTDAVFLCQSFGTKVSIRLGLEQLHNALLALRKARARGAQFVLDLSLRQNKSGERFFALRLVYILDLLGFGGDVRIQKT